MYEEIKAEGGREMTQARIKSTGEIVAVVSRFMPRKRNAPSRDWVCVLSNDTLIDEKELEYISSGKEDAK